MMKAQLTPRRRGAALLAGAVGHVLFALGWFGLGLSVIAGLVTLALGGLGGQLGELWGAQAEQIIEPLLGAGVVVGVVLTVIGVVSLIVAGLGILLGWSILRRGDVRRPGAVAWSAVAITAALDIPLFWIYIALAVNVTDSRVAGPVFLAPLFGILGSALLGALVWWWMAWVFRGPASRFAGVEVTAEATGVLHDDAEADDTPQTVGLEELLDEPAETQHSRATDAAPVEGEKAP